MMVVAAVTTAIMLAVTERGSMMMLESKLVEVDNGMTLGRLGIGF